MQEIRDLNDAYKKKRFKMVEEQIVNRGVINPGVLRAMKKVKRHLFVPENLRDSAYIDNPLPIGFNQTISQPYIAAFMTEALKLNQQDRILEIGTGSGYQSAILCELTDSVFSIEIIPQLVEHASSILLDLCYTNIQIKQGNGYNGWPEKAKFTKIIVTAAPPEIPKILIEQLSDQGIMVVPVGVSLQKLMLIKKNGDDFMEKGLLNVKFVPMIKKMMN